MSDARRAGSSDLERYFTTRALASGLATGALAVAGIVVLHADARYLYDGLTHEGLPLVILSALCGLGAVVLLRRGARRGARPLAVGAVVAVVWGWGVAQYPYLLPQKLTIADGAATSATLTAVLIVFGVAVVARAAVDRVALHARPAEHDRGDGGPARLDPPDPRARAERLPPAAAPWSRGGW